MGVVDHFAPQGLTVGQYLPAILKQPSLFAYKPDKLTGNIERVVNSLPTGAMDVREFLTAALKQPSIFYQHPATLVANIEGVVRHFEADGLTICATLGRR